VSGGVAGQRAILRALRQNDVAVLAGSEQQ
jgi:hypothetical protein